MATTAEGVIAGAAELAPDSPGVYVFLGDDGELLYVGKATSLRKRLRQHAAESPTLRGLRVRYALVRDVRWEETADEDAAACREADLIVALRPPCNAGTDDGRWTFVIVTAVNNAGDTDRLRSHLRLRLSPSVADVARSARVYGCFPHLGRGLALRPGVACSDGYAAFLRLLWAASGEDERMPAMLTRTAPDDATIAVDESLRRALHAFLSGTSAALLGELAERASEAREPYMQPALRRDRELAAAFFRYGPRAVRSLRLRHGLAAGPVGREAVESLLAAELRASIGDFCTPRRTSVPSAPRTMARRPTDPR